LELSHFSHLILANAIASDAIQKIANVVMAEIATVQKAIVASTDNHLIKLEELKPLIIGQRNVSGTKSSPTISPSL
jgi:hypothetical protein